MQKTLIAACLSLAALSQIAWGEAQQTPLQRSELQKLALPPDLVGFMDLVTIAANGVVPPFVHPGVQLGYVLEGDLVLEVEGRPPLELKPGTSFKIPANAAYSFENRGAQAARLIDFVVEKDAPGLAP